MKLFGAFAVLFVTCQAYEALGRNGKAYHEIEKCFASDDNFASAGEERDIFEINKGIEGLIDSDIIPPENPDTRNAVTDPTRYWTSTTIPVEYSDRLLHLEAIGSIELARQEYRLRTCLDFIDRTDERNYISFQARSGCFSYVGMVGLAQIISIGVGCERLGTVCHEMMHAIGIYHEQSRADRDDYVEIQWDLISPGYENNFNKYDWKTTDPRGLPYDYTSIMHYSDSGFSTTGDPTIVTRDPAFQDVIGQRTTFSRSDSEKINRMYNCSDTLLYSYNCNFDDATECGYVQERVNDDLDWTRYDVGSAPEAFSSEAPSDDATVGIEGRGTYMVMDTRIASNGAVAKMRSKRFVTKSPVQCLQFSYYIKNSNGIGTSLAVHIASLDDTTGEVVNEGEPIVEFAENYDNTWNIQRITIQAPSAYRLIFVGTAVGDTDQIVAIDDISVIDKKCDDDYVEIANYQDYLDNYKVDESFLTPVMVSEQGYNFRLRVFPNGRNESSDGYMSMFFGIVQGPNDDDLDWPFCNKYMRMSIMNKEADPLYQQNRFLEYVTSQSVGGSSWNKPTSNESLGYLGYYNYMRISDLTDPTKNFLKHGSIMFSVLIQDMNWVNGEVCSGSFEDNRALASRGLNPELESPNEKYRNSGEHDKGHGGEHGGHGEHENHGDNGVVPIFNKTSTTAATATSTTTPANQEEALVSVTKVVAFTLASSAFILIVMSAILCCVVKSHKKNLKAVANANLTM